MQLKHHWNAPKTVQKQINFAVQGMFRNLPR